jgi:hypothetical protein
MRIFSQFAKKAINLLFSFFLLWVLLVPVPGVALVGEEQNLSGDSTVFRTNTGANATPADSLNLVRPDSGSIPTGIFIDSSVKVPDIQHFFDSVTNAAFPQFDSAEIEDEYEDTLQYMEYNRILGKNAIKHLYFQGDFDKIIAILENFRKSGDMVEKEDSLIVYKYLGVIYGSDPEQKTKGEGYLYSLLKLNPKETMKDMQLSGQIEDLFESVKYRYLTDFPIKEVENPRTPLPLRPQPKETKGDHVILLWTAGILTVAGILAVLLFK